MKPHRIFVGGKRTIEYVFDALSRLNGSVGVSNVLLCSIGAGMGKCAEVASLLEQEFGIRIADTRLVSYARDESSFRGLEILMESDGGMLSESHVPLRSDGFIEYPVYHLLLSAYLHKHKEIIIEVNDRDTRPFAHRGNDPQAKRIAALKIVQGAGDYKLSVSRALLPAAGERSNLILENVTAALYRSGVLLSRSWDLVSNALCEDDDVILGLDTNVLRECLLTQQLLDGFILHNTNGHAHAPNWVLLIIPNGVIHEIEQIANSREPGGKLSQDGRLGYRALAEILEIDQSKDLTGISLLIVGEADPVLDARVELRGLRSDMGLRASKGAKILLKRLAAGDTHIRDQFKQFLRQISFHKGTYFLTADKSNNALARAEGLRSIYYAQASGESVRKAGSEITMPRVLDGDGPLLTVPLAKIIFELAVQFERISLVTDQHRIPLECDVMGESLMHWVHKRIKVKGKEHLKTLLGVYASAGRFSLSKAEETWERLNKQLMDEGGD